MKEGLKKFLLSISLIGAFVVYVVYQHFGRSTAPAVTPPPTTGPEQTNTAPVTSPPPTHAPTPALPPRVIGWRDGSFVGDVTDAYYGNVQVEAVIQNGKIVDVKFLQYPSDRRTSIEINSQAMPYLTYEAIQAQSANVDIISGATATSGAFRESLQSALAKAISTP